MMVVIPPVRRGAQRVSARSLGATLFALAALMLASMTVMSSPAGADTAQSGGPPDGGDHSWCYLANFEEQTAADAAMTRLRNQTDVTTSYPGSCGEHTDVRWRQGGLTDAFGEAVCVARWAGSGDCDVYRITMDMGAINNAPQPVRQRSKTSCHELGHTVGVRHYTAPDRPGNDTEDSCMRSGTVNANWTNITVYGNHHRTQHINVTF